MATAATAPPYAEIRDIRDWRSAQFASQTGFGAIERGSRFSNLTGDQIAQIAQMTTDRILADMRRISTQRLLKLQSIFQQRFEADSELFAGLDKAKINYICAIMAQQMLVFFPDRISADITADASIVLQAHYGGIHVYWECFFDAEEPIPYATLNITYNKIIIYSKGGDFTVTQQELVSFIFPKFKALFEKI
jgi:hypothetical protein